MELIYNRHPSLYFNDGSIVLTAPSSSSLPTSNEERVVFRVHASLLAKLSEVFKDMLTLPPTEDAEKYDGVPVVHMTDSAAQLESLLKLVYHETELPFKAPYDGTVDAVRDILLLANKYGMDNLRQRIVSRLERDWPSRLVDWDILNSELIARTSTLRDMDNADRRVPSEYDAPFPDAAAAIRFAMECNIPSILPAAFYHLSCISATNCRTHEDSVYFRDNARCSANWTLLTTDDFILLLRLKERIKNFVSRQLLLIPNSCEICSGVSESKSEGTHELLFANITGDCDKLNCDVLRVLAMHIADLGKKWDDDSECHNCLSRYETTLCDIRQHLWDLLPSIL